VGNGVDLSPPNLDAGAAVIVRHDFTQSDGVSGGAGAVGDPYASAALVRVYNAASGGAPLGTAPVNAAGGFAEVPFGLPTPRTGACGSTRSTRAAT